MNHYNDSLHYMDVVPFTEQKFIFLLFVSEFVSYKIWAEKFEYTSMSRRYDWAAGKVLKIWRQKSNKINFSKIIFQSLFNSYIRPHIRPYQQKCPALMMAAKSG